MISLFALADRPGFNRYAKSIVDTLQSCLLGLRDIAPILESQFSYSEAADLVLKFGKGLLFKVKTA